MLISQAGMAALAVHEGIVPGPYRDSVGVWTYGIGHTHAAGPPDPRRMPRGMPEDLDAAIREAVSVYAIDVARYAAEVDAAITTPIEQHQFDALVSFHFNTGAIGTATLTRRVNARDFSRAAGEFDRWVKPREIRDRRMAEKALFWSGTYPTEAIPVWSITTSGRVVFRPVRTIPQADFLAMLAPPTPIDPPIIPARLTGLTRAQVRSVQHALNAAGLGPLKIDGIAGTATRAAHAAFWSRGQANAATV